MGERELFRQVADCAARHVESLAERPAGSAATVDELEAALGGPLPGGPSDPGEVVFALAEAADPGLVATPGGRYFGFVEGGVVPAALAADWLTSLWDQDAGLFVSSPAAAVVEEVCRGWLAELLGLPAHVSVGFVTGCQMAHFTGLAAARHRVLADAGWNVELDGLPGAPRVRVLAGELRHITVDRAVRFLGFGTGVIVPVAADDQGRMRPDALRSALAEGNGPTIVCAQVGEVNTGSIDPLAEIADAVDEAGAWLHVDGAFGMWAAADPALRPLVDGIDRARSWATDCHKWLNVPFDSGLAFCADADAHRAAMSVTASYLVQGDRRRERDQVDWHPEFSRRARGFPIYAAIRSLGRQGIADLVEGCCARARLFAGLLEAGGAEVLNEVVLNQVLVRFGDDDRTREAIRLVQEDGTCWVAGTVWRGQAAMRISVSSWRTTDEDVERSADAMLRAARTASGVRARGEATAEGMLDR